jgi:hypothetical protein
MSDHHKKIIHISEWESPVYVEISSDSPRFVVENTMGRIWKNALASFLRMYGYILIRYSN